MTDMTRREFSRRTAAAALVGPYLPRGVSRPPARVAVVGVNARGARLAQGFATLPDVEVSHLCDVDDRAIERAMTSLADAADPATHRPPRAVRDFRSVLDDPDVDAVVIATPDHWHAPATILACAAGKHVYVEKPCSHNAHEGELMVAAARKHGRVVQMGVQRRSRPQIRAAIDLVLSGAIGRVYYARAWYANGRPSIGHGRAVDPPDSLDWDLWQGPAPRVGYRDNVVHYDWHWSWRWGTGELGNNGVHALDLCRWGLGAGLPIRVFATGSRYRYDDDWECPDTQIATFELDGAQVTWEGLSCSRHGIDGRAFGASFHGADGTVVVDASGWRHLDADDHVVREERDPDGDLPHLANFVDAIHGRAELTAPIDDGHRSTLWCHLGNIAQRVGRTLSCDPEDGRIVDDAEAMTLWRRDYEPGWEPAV